MRFRFLALAAVVTVAGSVPFAEAHLGHRAAAPSGFQLPKGTQLNTGGCSAPGQLAGTATRAFDPNNPNIGRCQPAPPPTPPATVPPGPLENKIVAFTSGLDLSLDGNGFRGGIWVQSADGSAARKVIQYETFLRSPVAHTFQEPDDHPAISPDGTRIAWTSSRGDPNPGILGVTNWDIWVADINGGNMQRLTTDPALDTEPAWSANGSEIYYAHGTDPFFGDGDLDIYKVPAAGGAVSPVVAHPDFDDFEPDLSSDGTRMAFTRDTFGQYEVMVTNLAGGNPVRLTNNDEHDHDANFTQGNDSLLITSEEGNVKQPYGDVYEIDATTGATVKRVTNFLLSRGDPNASANGQLVATMQPVAPITRSPHIINLVDRNGESLGFAGGSGVVDIHPNVGHMADTDGDGTPNYLESGSVGEAQLDLPKRARPGKTIDVTFAWDHPEAWRQLDGIELMLTSQGQPIGAIRLLINSLQLSAWENELGGYGLAKQAGEKGVLRSGGLELDLKRSKVINTSEQTITTELALSVTKKLAGRSYGVSVQAADDDGDHQGERLAGEKITIGGRPG